MLSLCSMIYITATWNYFGQMQHLITIFPGDNPRMWNVRSIEMTLFKGCQTCMKQRQIWRGSKRKMERERWWWMERLTQWTHTVLSTTTFKLQMSTMYVCLCAVLCWVYGMDSHVIKTLLSLSHELASSSYSTFTQQWISIQICKAILVESQRLV